MSDWYGVNGTHRHRQLSPHWLPGRQFRLPAAHGVPVAHAVGVTDGVGVSDWHEQRQLSSVIAPGAQILCIPGPHGVPVVHAVGVGVSVGRVGVTDGGGVSDWHEQRQLSSVIAPGAQILCMPGPHGVPVGHAVGVSVGVGVAVPVAVGDGEGDTKVQNRPSQWPSAKKLDAPPQAASHTAGSVVMTQLWSHWQQPGGASVGVVVAVGVRVAVGVTDGVGVSDWHEQRQLSSGTAPGAQILCMPGPHGVPVGHAVGVSVGEGVAVLVAVGDPGDGDTKVQNRPSQWPSAEKLDAPPQAVSHTAGSVVMTQLLPHWQQPAGASVGVGVNVTHQQRQLSPHTLSGRHRNDAPAHGVPVAHAVGVGVVVGGVGVADGVGVSYWHEHRQLSSGTAPGVQTFCMPGAHGVPVGHTVGVGVGVSVAQWQRQPSPGKAKHTVAVSGGQGVPVAHAVGDLNVGAAVGVIVVATPGRAQLNAARTPIRPVRHLPQLPRTSAPSRAVGAIVAPADEREHTRALGWRQLKLFTSQTNLIPRLRGRRRSVGVGGAGAKDALAASG